MSMTLEPAKSNPKSAPEWQLPTKCNVIYGKPPGVEPGSKSPSALGSPITLFSGFLVLTLRQIAGILAQLYASIGDWAYTGLRKHDTTADKATRPDDMNLDNILGKI